MEKDRQRWRRGTHEARKMSGLSVLAASEVSAAHPQTPVICHS